MSGAKLVASVAAVVFGFGEDDSDANIGDGPGTSLFEDETVLTPSPLTMSSNDIRCCLKAERSDIFADSVMDGASSV